MLADKSLASLLSERLNPVAGRYRYKDSQPNIRQNSWNLVNESGNVKDTIRKLTNSTNLDLRGLTETEPLSEDRAWAGPRSPTHV